MEAWIKDISNKNCYTRFGKIIPKKETKIDIEKYFGKDVLKQLQSDLLIKVIVHNATDKEEQKKEAVKKEVEVKDFEKKETERVQEVTKTVRRRRS